MKKLIVFIFIAFLAISCENIDFGTSADSGNTTTNGSYAKMIKIGNFLYAINDNQLATYDVSDAKNPNLLDKQDVGFQIENIYHSEGVLFIGSSQNLHIFAIGQNGIPSRKNQVAYFEITNFCSKDPVIVNGNYAYVTLSEIVTSVENCTRATLNELRIYNIADLGSPKLKSVTQMNSPKGLSIDGNLLFVCEQHKGVQVFDVTDKTQPVKINYINLPNAYDVIATNKVLMVVSSDQIREYDYSDVLNIKTLGKIILE